VQVLGQVELPADYLYELDLVEKPKAERLEH
jgi:hypothetical protein